MGLGGSEESVSGSAAGAGVLPCAGVLPPLPWDQGTTASAEGPALRRAARRCRAPASFAPLRVPMGPVTVIPRAPALRSRPGR